MNHIANWRPRICVASLLAVTLFGALSVQSADQADAKLQIPRPDGKPADMTKPVQVFIIMGQSNAVGMGTIESLVEAVKNKKKYQYLVDDAGNWTERKDVRNVRYMFNDRGLGVGLMNNEWMSVKGVNVNGGHLGVEYGLGNILGNAIDAPVMILKSCQGNRSLGLDLLPPGSEPYEYNGKMIPGYRGIDTDPKGNGEIPKVPLVKGHPPRYHGIQYDRDTAEAKNALAQLDKHYPGAKSSEVAGFFFWQGEKDVGDDAFASNYEKNLVNFIKALRKDFNAPNAKFVLATLGESKKGSGGNGGKVLDAHLAVDGNSGKHPEFKGNVAAVYTHPMAQGGSGNGHYGKKSEVYMDVGEAMGKAMAELLKK